VENFLSIGSVFVFYGIIIKKRRYNMKKVLLLLSFAILGFGRLCADMSLVVKPLSGAQSVTALAKVGKVVYSGDYLIVYDNDGSVVYRTPFSEVQHVRYSDEVGPEDPVEVEMVDESMSVVAYPNPTSDVLYVENADGDCVRLYSVDGCLLEIVQLNDGSVSIDMSDYSAGTYVLVSGNRVFNVIKR
jgi:hypothetical protein